MDYWFYLEPYTFLLRNENKVVVYNTFNSAYLICSDHPVVQRILGQWEDAANGYGSVLNERDLEDEIVKDFVNAIRDSFSGDCVKYDKRRPKPYLFKPTLFLNTDIRIESEKNKASLRERILQNLHEVTVYLPASCNRGCSACASYYRQFGCCTTCNEGILKLFDYTRLLRQLQVNGIRRINLSGGGDPLGNSYAHNLLMEFSEAAFKKHLYLNFNFLSDEYIGLMQRTKTILEVLVHLDETNQRQIIENMQKHSCGTIRWNLIVTNDSDMEYIDYLEFPETTDIQLRPFYTEDNLVFFQKFVFLNLQDVLAFPVDRKSIFRHKVLNDYFFGKLSVFPSGEVYSSVNSLSLGNIRHSSFKELVYKELTERDVWLKIRGNETPCDKCINKDLCPSISNYEWVIGKNNLCHVKL